jgi:hypothetical protein
MLRAAGLSTLLEKKMNWLVFSKGSNEGEIDPIPKDKAERIVEIIKKGSRRESLLSLHSGQRILHCKRIVQACKAKGRRCSFRCGISGFEIRTDVKEELTF